MTISLIGTDEAGYGPNLGPLTIAGTLWSAEDEQTSLYRQLEATVSWDGSTAQNRLTIADSKKIHRPDDLSHLELPVLAILYAAWGTIPSSLMDFYKMLSGEKGCASLQQQCWLQDCQLTLPVDVNADEVCCLGDRFRRNCSEVGIHFQKVICSPVFANEFNQLLDDRTNKADLLSSNTLGIVRSLIDAASVGTMVSVHCDKHGGRSRYSALLQAFLAPEMVSVVMESSARSAYRFLYNQLDVEIQFTTNGEAFFATAVSSMIAKYCREVVMIGWNQFWQARVPALRSTKGYPSDARRFIKEIDQERKKLGIELEAIWRTR